MTGPKTTRTLVLLAILAGLSSCNKPELPTYVRLKIATTTLPDAKLGLNYDFTMTAEGGQGTITWSATAMPGALGWLTIDATGKFSGVPTTKLSPGEAFLVRAVDARGETAEKTMTLQALECIGNEETACYRFDTTAQQCQKSSVLCSNGRFPDCGAGAVSTELDHCGPPASGLGCGSCGTFGDSCNGICKCGVNGACSGPTPDCCAGGCVNFKNDVQNCGSCGNVCPPSTAANMVAACTNGQCVFDCALGYTSCDSGCVNTNTDPQNCGGCGVPCGGGGVCSGGNCRCPSGQSYCPGNGCIPSGFPCSPKPPP